ncbi:MAG TPA: GntR family transcriptional regulator [Bryobacteraceae bacterium]|nr:GntR family transcriptional regulator [Bryobacteraceae bacterium]
MVISKTAPEREGEVDRVYRLLKTWILDARLRPGDFLSEVELARQCETSRTPVREACNLLSQERWIQRIRHKGYLLPPISIRDIIEVYDYRKIIECFCAERAASAATPEEVKQLGDIIAAEDQIDLPMAAFLKANQQFHVRLGEIANNQRVLEQLHLTLEYVRRLDILSTQKDTRPVPHRDILRAIEARNVQEAGRSMAEHITLSRDQMLRLFGT